jgi:hypothetical protein
MITFTKVSSAPHLLRYLIASDGTANENVLRANALLLADMQEGPLKTLWRVSGLTLAALNARCLRNANADVRILPNSSAAVDVGRFSAFLLASIDGKPDLVIGYMDGTAATAALLTLEFRHSIHR